MRKAHVVAFALSALTGVALAKLPPLTPEQEQAAAAKKEAEKANVEKEKVLLERSQDRVAEYYRKTKGAAATKPSTAALKVEDTNMPKTAKEPSRNTTAPQGGTKQSAEAHSAPAK
jgi:hypothetical protein